MTEHWTTENIELGFSAKSHIQNVVPKFEDCFDRKFKTGFKTPMSTEYHPEVDETPFLSDEDASKFRSVIGSLNWLITLGRFDVHCATNALSRFSMAPREGHLKAALMTLSHVRSFSKGRMLFDTSYPVLKEIEDNDFNWREQCPDASE